MNAWIKKNFNTLLIIFILLQPILDLNIVGLNYAQDFAKDLSKVITRDDYSVLNVMYDNISAFKDTGYMDKE